MPELDFEGVEKEASRPYTEREHTRLMLQIDKNFQFRVLFMFTLATIIIFFADMLYFRVVGESIFLKVMAIITPLFTLTLGIGTNVKS